MLIKPFCAALILLPLSCGYARGDEPVKSVHLGLFHPNGVDVLGYSVEKQFDNNIYTFYTFGFPSLAAIGYSYYKHHEADSFTGTLGVGIGSVFYGSIAYQWITGDSHCLKLGVGWTTGVAYKGVYPVLTYEFRLGR